MMNACIRKQKHKEWRLLQLIEVEVNLTYLSVSGFIVITQVGLNNVFTLQTVSTAFYNTGRISGNKAVFCFTLNTSLPLADCNISDGRGDSQAAGD